MNREETREYYKIYYQKNKEVYAARNKAKKEGTYVPTPRAPASPDEKKARQRIYTARFRAKQKALKAEMRQSA